MAEVQPTAFPTYRPHGTCLAEDITGPWNGHPYAEALKLSSYLHLALL